MEFITALFSINSLVSLFVGLAGAWIFWKYQKRREDRIKTKIQELEYQESFITKIDKGYQNLLRYGLRSLFFALFLFFGGSALIIVLYVLPDNVSQIISPAVLLISAGFFISAALICLDVFNNVSSLSNLKIAIEKLNEKKEKLNKKI